MKPEQGYRHYSDNILNQIHFIKRAQKLGFTLDEIKGLLKLTHSSCSQVQSMTEQKLSVVQQKIADLQCLEKALVQLLSECRGNDNPDDCPVIHSLQP